jgi:hypothetical protein
VKAAHGPLVVTAETMRARKLRRALQISDWNPARAVSTKGDRGRRPRSSGPCAVLVGQCSSRQRASFPFPFGTRMNLSMHGTTRPPPPSGASTAATGRSSGAAFDPALMAQRLAGAPRRTRGAGRLAPEGSGRL